MKLDYINFFEILPDIFNCLLLLLGIFYFSVKHQLNKKYFIALSISSLLPFVFYWLWHWSFLPDQSKYADMVYNFRNLNYDQSMAYLFASKTNVASLLLAFFPIPFVTTIISISLINKGILCFVILYFLKQKKYYFVATLLLFLPSMIVISSVALREMLVVALGIFFFFFFIKKKYYLRSIFVGILFILTKPHLGIISCGVAISYYIFFVKFSFKKSNSFFFIAIMQIALLILLYFLQDYLRMYREGFLREEFGYRLLLLNDSDLSVSLFLSHFINFLFSPISTEGINLMNIIILTENLFIMFILILLLKKIYKENKNIAIFWIQVWITTFAFQAYILTNAGTIWRYKFTIQIVFLCATYFSLENKKKLTYSKI